MHKYLASVGFSEVRTRKQVTKLIKEVVENYDEKFTVPNYDDGVYVEYIKYYAREMGLAVCGQFDTLGKYHVEYYYPFLVDSKITTTTPLTVEMHYDKSSYAAACDDLRLGVTLIYYLQRPAEYMLLNEKLGDVDNPIPVILTGLAYDGTILLPLHKNKEELIAEQEQTKKKTELMAAAMDGDEEAMETLTKDEMEIYTMISERIQNEDVLTIVDSYFMPFGIECDQYNVMGEIRKLQYLINQLTGEELVRMTLGCNNIEFDILINRKELLGEPKVGRRFKGVIWLQGRIDYDALPKENAVYSEEGNKPNG